MINILQGISFMGVLVGVAGVAGAIELNQSPAAAFITMIVSIILLLLFEGIEKNGKNNKRIY